MKINELLFSLAVRPTDRATALPLPRQLSSCLPAVRWTVKEGRKDGKSGGERERTTILILPFLPLLRASDNPSGGSNSLFEGQFHRLCRSGDGNTSWTLLSPHLSAAPLPASWSRVQEMGLLNFKSMLMLPVVDAGRGGEGETDRREVGTDWLPHGDQTMGSRFE